MPTPNANIQLIQQSIGGLKDMLSDINNHNEKRFDLLEGRVDQLEGRMKAYEDQAKENTAVLKQVNLTIQSYERTIKGVVSFLKWGGGIAITTVIGQAIISIFHLFGH